MLAAVYICLCQFVLHLGVFSSLHPLSPFLSGITNLPLHAVNTPLWRSGAHNHLPSVCCFAFLSFLIRPASSLLIFYPCLFCFHTHHRDVTTIAALQCYSHAAGQASQCWLCGVWVIPLHDLEPWGAREVQHIHSLERCCQSHSNATKLMKRQKEISYINCEQISTGFIFSLDVVV